MRRLLSAAAILLAISPLAASAQEQTCDLVQGPFGRAEQREENGVVIQILHDPFTVTCEDGTELRANSGRLNQGTREVHLVGSVFFQDAERTLTSDEATYNRGTERLWARGNVVFENRTEGSTLRGPELEYFRETAERPLAQVFATRRPRLTMAGREASPQAEPLELVGDRIIIVGGDDLTAFGSVVITRTDFEATSEEARYNSTTEALELRQNAVISSDEYDLAGDVISATLVEGSLEHVHSRTNATLAGEDLNLSAPDIQLFFSSDTLRRVIARVPPEVEEERARAQSRTFRTEADSIDAVFVDQLLTEVIAIGEARGESVDSTESFAAAPEVEVEIEVEDDAPAAPRPEAVELATHYRSDWIRGDTILAFFEPTELPEPATVTPEPARPDADIDLPPAGDDAPRVELRRLIARGSAQSYYRMAAEGSAEGSPRRNLSFLVGEQIELEISDGELREAQVTGLQRGIHLEAASTANVAPAEPGAPVQGPDPEPGPPGDAN